MKKIYTLILLAVFGLCNLAQAQQFPYYYQYLMNKYSLSPAYGGMYGITEGYLGYRHNLVNVDYGPRTLMFNINTPVGKKSGVGISIMNDKADIFSNLYASGSYAYHLMVAKDHYVDFGVTAGFLQKRVDLSGALDNPLVDPNDPLWQGKNKINSTSLEFGAGLMYRWKTLNVGFSIPSFYEVSSGIYEFKMQINPYISYDFKLDTNWNLEPSVVIRTVPGAPLSFDVNAYFRYKEKIWFGPTFRSNMIAGISVGGEVAKNVVMLYTYDFAVPFSDYKGVIGGNYGGHEITVGYRFGNRNGKKKEKLATSAQVDTLAKKNDDLNKQVKALADSLAKIKQYKDPNPAIKDLENQINLLNKKILETTGTDKDIARIAKTVYFVTGSDQLTDYSKGKLDELVDIMKKYPTFRLTIEGFTDNVGSASSNQTLSDKRAHSVGTYLIGKGIDSKRFTTAGFGETRPVDTNDTKAGRQNNRRTEIKAY
ncbi:MAG: PorP/SprF family type IX secretion system membrane protein [Bacteroidota bacterium]